MQGVVKVEWHDQDYLHFKWHVVCRGLATPALYQRSPDEYILAQASLTRKHAHAIVTGNG